jgi:hypothetical protein
LRRELTYHLQSLNVLIPDTGVTIESSLVLPEGTVQAEGANYLTSVGRDLAPGEVVELRLSSGQGAGSQPAPSRSSSGSLPWVLLGIVVAVVFLGYPFWLQRVRATVASESDAKPPNGDEGS